MNFTEIEIERQRAANISHELEQTRSELESALDALHSTNETLRDMTDTCRAMTLALCGQHTLDDAERVFNGVAGMPSDYCRAYRKALMHFVSLAERKTWPGLETVNNARRILGMPELSELPPSEH